jgi:hypothetical protein
MSLCVCMRQFFQKYVCSDLVILRNSVRISYDASALHFRTGNIQALQNSKEMKKQKNWVW